ncbi:MAG: FRG domain-containing protein [Planctomycetota bacterium]
MSVETCGEVTSLSELTEVAKRAPSRPSFPIWWRGQARSGWHLTPRLLREGLEPFEPNIFITFVNRARVRHAECPSGDRIQDWLTFAQHYRLPTRLLDWSTSVLAAAYFAAEPGTDEDQAKPGAVWALDPGKLNEDQLGDGSLQTLSSKKAIPIFDRDRDQRLLKRNLERRRSLYELVLRILKDIAESHTSTELEEAVGRIRHRGCAEQNSPSDRPDWIAGLRESCAELAEAMREPSVLKALVSDTMGAHRDERSLLYRDKIAAITTSQIDVRMMMQQAAFTVHGTPQGIDELAQAPTFLWKYEIPARAKSTLRDELSASGFGDQRCSPIWKASPETWSLRLVSSFRT